MKLLIISGRSGSGKSVILQTLEDLQYYCVDNLPPSLLPTLLQQLKERNVNIAVSIDARNISHDENKLAEIISQIKSHHPCHIIYLDATDDTLIRRFKETRRRHPLTSSQLSLQEALKKEHLLLAPLVETVDFKIDTSMLTPQQLRKLILDYVEQQNGSTLSILLESFGYKYGIPHEADFIFDVRCLPNPYWDTKLRYKTGLDSEVTEYLETQPLCQEMFEDIKQFLLKWIPAYLAEHRKYLTIAIGCTGGLHRSVYLVNKLGEALKLTLENISIRHRELT
ncbi:MAG: RNase adaptor protein RapZ [Gammaproteobacteria bacterium RIFCSPHIGHO2_12_FULL_35_23]|nr:MAG: RNase adaptor protein RapZ [Gammaproteobacteria bacterium RIFCSPHIGHO2_12_FULL_35_23]